MTTVSSLEFTVEATHTSLEQWFNQASVKPASPSQPRNAYQRADTFMATTSRHLAAVDAVLLPLVKRRLADGPGLVREYLHQARRLERSLARTKAKLYGSAHAIHAPWSEIWGAVRASLDAHNALELAFVAELVAVLTPEEWDTLAQRVHDAETTAPTRPHPYSPHTGIAGRVARRCWAVADRFWDDMEGRVIPVPVQRAARSSDSLLSQYLLGIPHLDRDATLIGQRTPRRARPAAA